MGGVEGGASRSRLDDYSTTAAIVQSKQRRRRGCTAPEGAVGASRRAALIISAHSLPPSHTPSLPHSSLSGWESSIQLVQFGDGVS